tara:strand:+ start:21735 stop:22004 length:270 start_codon:yes stop_codon:yes gene_type:complete
MIMTLDTQVEKNIKDLPLREVVSNIIEQYIITMEDQTIESLHSMVIKEVELGLFKKVLQLCQGNQSLAAKWLGLARGTLRKRLAEYNLE